MRKFVVLLFVVLCPFASRLSAQVRIGYLSYDSVMQQMPEYAQAKQSLLDLKAKYDQEATRGEEEFQRKFAEFLQGQKDFPQNILIKRQAELQALMENGVAFRQEAKQLLSQAEVDLLKEVSRKLDDAISQVGLMGGYACILNTDNHQSPFVNPAMGDDVTDQVLQKLGIKPISLPLVPEPTPAPVSETVAVADPAAESVAEAKAVKAAESTAATAEELQAVPLTENAE